MKSAQSRLVLNEDHNSTAPELEKVNLYVRRPRRKKVKAKLVESEKGTLRAFLDNFYNKTEYLQVFCIWTLCNHK